MCNNYVKVKSTNDKYKQNSLHQFIWMVANKCDIPEGYDIHHIDGNPLNNSIYNLELVEHSQHEKFHKIGTIMKDSTKEKLSTYQINNSPLRKKVCQYTLDGELVKIWNSVRDAARNDFTHTSIIKCCKGINQQHKGYIWKYLEEG